MINGLKALATLVALLAPLTARAAEPPAFEVLEDSLALQAELPAYKGELPGWPDWVRFGFDFVWTVSGNKLAQVDPADNSAVGIQLGKERRLRVRALGLDEDAVWVADVAAQTLFKIDPTAGTIVKQVAIGATNPNTAIGVGEGAVWLVTDAEYAVKAAWDVVNFPDSALARINADSGEIEATIRLPSRGGSVLFDSGSAWVTGLLDDEVYRIDAKTNALAATITVGKWPGFLAAAAGSVWVLSQFDGAVQRIDPATNAVVATIETGLAGGEYWDLVAGGGYLWMLSQTVPVVQIDPRTNTVLRRFKSTGRSHSIAFGAGSIWVAGEDALRRFQPPR